jgi:hypothetical protein
VHFLPNTKYSLPRSLSWSNEGMVSSRVALDYREAHSLPLLSSTTCFTGARRQQKWRRAHRDEAVTVAPPADGAINDDPRRGGAGPAPSVVATAVLATELHALTLHLDPNGACSVEAIEVSSLLPEGVEGADSDFSCVGFDVLDEEWQVVALMRRTTAAGEDEAGAASDSNGAWRGGSMSDMTALLSVATSPEDASVVAPPSQPGSAAGTAADSGGATHRRSGSSAALEMNASSSGLSLLPPDQLQRLVAQSANPQVHLVLTSTHDPTVSASACLDFRPLAPTLCRFGSPSESSSDSVGVWLGSADDCKLRLYELGRRDDRGDVGDDAVASRRLHLVDFDQLASQEDLDSFSFRSPVMALDWCRALFDDERQCVAAACQDGTIRLITYSADFTTIPKFKDVRETTVIVDGPIVCVSLARSVTHVGVSRNFVQCLVGSLCGYACEIRMWDTHSPQVAKKEEEEEDPESPSTAAGNEAVVVSWHGPYLIAQGLWNNRLNCEDSVLCVSSSTLQLQDGQMLQLAAVGTHAGRCRVYGSSARSDVESLRMNVEASSAGPSVSSYELLWECKLPYSIHGVLWLSFTASSTTSTKDCGVDSRTLLVTTRRSVHVFRLRSGEAYDANVALERLKSLMEEERISSSERDPSHHVTTPA